MSLRHFACAVVTTIVAAGCGQRSHPVALDASPMDREALVGDWEGSYRIEGKRGGSIVFTLGPRGDQVSGDVLMVAEGAREPYTQSMPDGLPRGAGPSGYSEVLTIRFVRAIDGQLTGEITPYWDPARRCLAQATFRGVVDGNRMDGTLVSTCEGGPPTYTGRWAMRRKGPAPPR
jgi:hypothetical protein